MDAKSVRETVKDQYEDLPYPLRNPADEKTRIVTVRTGCLDFLNHCFYQGGKDFSKPYRVLIVGGGTGDIDVFWAENLRYNDDAEIVSIDLSSASQGIAKERLKIRGLERKVRHINDSLFNLPSHNLGEFDFINCSGVLHHTHDPDLGLKTLAGLAKEDGILDIMVYGRHGRYGIYPLQELLRIANTGITDKQEKLEHSKEVLNNLRMDNYFVANLKDMSIGNPTDFYDLLLHEQDRAYSVPEMYDFAAAADLNVLEFFSLRSNSARDDYLPEKYIHSKELRDKTSKLPLKDRQTMAEILNSRMKMHVFFLSKSKPKELELDLDVIPSFAMRYESNANEIFYDLIQNSGDIVTVNQGTLQVKFRKTPHLAAIFKYLDGERTLRQIFELVIEDSSDKPTQEQLMVEFAPIFHIFNNQYWLFLRQQGIPKYATRSEYQARVL